MAHAGRSERRVAARQGYIKALPENRARSLSESNKKTRRGYRRVNPVALQATVNRGEEDPGWRRI